MWIPKWYFEAQARMINDLERRMKRLELVILEDAERKIASLSDKEAGATYRDGLLTIKEIINKNTDT